MEGKHKISIIRTMIFFVRFFKDIKKVRLFQSFDFKVRRLVCFLFKNAHKSFVALFCRILYELEKISTKSIIIVEYGWMKNIQSHF